MVLYFTEGTDHLKGGECSDHSCFRTLHLGREFFFNWNWTSQKYFRIQSSLSTPPTVFSLSGQDTESTASKLLLDSLLMLRSLHLVFIDGLKNQQREAHFHYDKHFPWFWSVISSSLKLDENWTTRWICLTWKQECLSIFMFHYCATRKSAQTHSDFI